MERAIAKAVESVRAGQPLAPPLAESGMFDEDVLEMIAVAETANNLGEVLLTIAETTESRVDRLLSAVVKLIEPLLLIFLATIVGLIAAALVIPLTQMGRNLG
jgi:general secretion pathway protein F/type IV pilus assembly protein PilC